MPRIAADYVDVWLFRGPAARPEFLLLQRAGTGPTTGLWLPVMGRIEASETAAAAAVRECREEAGLVPAEVYQIDSVHTFFMAATDTIQMTPVFAGRVPDDAPVALSAEHSAWRWAAYPDLVGELVWPGQRESVGHVVREIVAGSAAKPLLRVK